MIVDTVACSWARASSLLKLTVRMPFRQNLLSHQLQTKLRLPPKSLCLFCYTHVILNPFQIEVGRRPSIDGGFPKQPFPSGSLLFLTGARTKATCVFSEVTFVSIGPYFSSIQGEMKQNQARPPQDEPR